MIILGWLITCEYARMEAAGDIDAGAPAVGVVVAAGAAAEWALPLEHANKYCYFL